MRVPWTVWWSNQSILREISPECSLEGLMLKLKLQYFGHLMQRADSLEKTMMLGKIEGGRRRGWQRMRWRWVWVNFGSWLWTGRPGVPQSMRSQRFGPNWVTELNWNWDIYCLLSRGSNYNHSLTFIASVTRLLPLWKQSYCLQSCIILFELLYIGYLLLNKLLPSS